MQLVLDFTLLVFALIFTCLFIFSGNFLDGILTAIVLENFFAVFRLITLVLQLVFVAVELLVVVLLLLLFHAFLVLEHHLVLLDHALQVLKDHLSGEEPSNQRLYFNNGD